MVDWSTELGIDLDRLALEHFSHPVAQYQNAQISKRSDDYWSLYVYSNPEPPSRLAHLDAKQRPRFHFSERQLEIAIRSVRKDEDDGQA